jgi:hypothetical protein
MKVLNTIIFAVIFVSLAYVLFYPVGEKYRNIQNNPMCSTVGQIVSTEDGKKIICLGPGQGILEEFQGLDQCPPEMKKKNLC